MPERIPACARVVTVTRCSALIPALAAAGLTAPSQVVYAVAGMRGITVFA